MRFLLLVQAACAQVVVVTTTATVYHTVHASPSVVGVSGFFNLTTPTSTISETEIQKSTFAEPPRSLNLLVSYQSPITSSSVPATSLSTEIPLFFGPTLYLTDRKHEYQNPGRVLEKGNEAKGEVQGTPVEAIGKLLVTSSGDDEEVVTSPAITTETSATESSFSVSAETPTTTETNFGYHEEKRKIQDVIERLLGRGSHNQSKSIETEVESNQPTSVPKKTKTHKTKTHTIFVNVTTTMAALDGPFSENRLDVGYSGTISQPLDGSMVSTTGPEGAVTTASIGQEDGSFGGSQSQFSLGTTGTKPVSLEASATSTNMDNQRGYKTEVESGSESKSSAAAENVSISDSGPTLAPSTAAPDDEMGPTSTGLVHLKSSPERPISPEFEVTTLTITQTANEETLSTPSLNAVSEGDASGSITESDIFRLPVETETQKAARTSTSSFQNPDLQNSDFSGTGSITLSSHTVPTSKPTEPVLQTDTPSTTEQVTKEPLSQTSGHYHPPITKSEAVSFPPQSTTYSPISTTTNSTTNSTTTTTNSTKPPTLSTKPITTTLSNSFPVNSNASTSTLSNSTNGATTTHPSGPANSTNTTPATALVLPPRSRPPIQTHSGCVSGSPSKQPWYRSLYIVVLGIVL